MPFRVTDAASTARQTRHLATARQRLASAQEQVASGKRINRPSDDPIGADIVIRLRTTQAQLAKFANNAASVKESLQVSDDVLNQFQEVQDRTRALLTRAATDPVVTNAREPIAIELDGITSRLHQLLNTKSGDFYVFGGTRIDAPPFDNAGVINPTATTEATVQVEPEGTLVATGVTAESFVSDSTGSILEALKAASAAVRGTGDATADRTTILTTLDRLNDFATLSNAARTKIGERMNHLDEVTERLTQYNLSVEETAQRIENVDLAEAAMKLTETNTALEAILQASSRFGRRSLLDFLG
ncbi:MAG TPA: flagellin [Blastocatellia bacterium]|nr:flagellin [Blastocatellia bacterium]